MINVDLLQRTLAAIEADPASWDQDVWAARTECGTVMCFAGHAVHLAHPGAEFEWIPRETLDGECALGVVVDVEYWGIAELAERLLGLDYDQRYRLFDGDNTLADLRRIVGGLVASAGGAS